MIYLQIATALVSLFIGLIQATKESQPYVQNVVVQQQLAQRKAYEIANMQINWQFRGSDNVWQYYSDQTGKYWARVNAQGICEYSENPNSNQ